MPFWDWRKPTRLRRESQELRRELLVAIGELNLFTVALKAEVDGGPGHDEYRPGEHRSR